MYTDRGSIGRERRVTEGREVQACHGGQKLLISYPSFASLNHHPVCPIVAFGYTQRTKQATKTQELERATAFSELAQSVPNY